VKNGSKSVIFGIISLLLLLPTTFSAYAGGMGVAPPKLEIKDVLRGSQRERTIKVFNSTSPTESKFALTAEGEARKWFRFYNPSQPDASIKTITVPAWKSSDVLVKVKIPKDAASGTYTAKIIVKKLAPGEKPEDTEKKKKKKAIEAVALQMPIAVKIGVTGEQILTGEVLSMLARDTEINYPLKILVEFMNTGNVIARPDIKVDITQAGLPVDSFTYNKVQVKVESKKIITVKWDTKGRGLGDYIAKVSVSLGKKQLTTENLQFKILPLGALTRKGYLESLSYKGNLKAGNTIKVLARFRNNGMIGTNAKFIGEVYRDGDLVDKIESENSLVPIYEVRTLESYLKIPGKGSYEVRGYVSFEGKKSNIRKLSFRLGYPLWMQILFFVATVLLVGTGVWFFVWRPRKILAKHAK
jgi:hypothetical protein